MDVYEMSDAFHVDVALPGVAADGLLTVAGVRRVPAEARSGALHRLEIPHGRFERRLALPLQPLELERRELLDSCLCLSLRKVAP